MNKPMNWPPGAFTIEAAIELNSHLPPAEVRKKLADGIAAKSIVQTQKGNGKVKGKFQQAKAA